MTPDADRSCEILADALTSGERFIHAKFGDGAIEVMHGTAKWQRSADGEQLWPDRHAAAEHCGWIWHTLSEASRSMPVYMGDWLTCSDPQGLEATWQAMQAGADFRYVAYETLLLHRLTPALLQFYRTLRSIPRKAVMTSWENRAVAQILDADYLPIPGPAQYRVRSDVIAKRAAALVLNMEPDVLILMGGGIAAAAQAYLIEAGAECSMVSLGSALDPLVREGRTRSGQVEREAAREYFRELL